MFQLGLGENAKPIVPEEPGSILLGLFFHPLHRFFDYPGWAHYMTSGKGEEFNLAAALFKNLRVLIDIEIRILVIVSVDECYSHFFRIFQTVACGSAQPAAAGDDSFPRAVEIRTVMERAKASA